MGQKLALLIANNAYDDTYYRPLVAPQADINALARVLSDVNIGHFDRGEILVDRPIAEIKERIERFFAGKKRDDLLLLYFSGHGDITKSGQLYLIGKETQRGLLGSTAISSTFIKEAMNESNAKQQILILDCCYSGAFVQGTKGGAQVSLQMATQFSGRGRVILTAAGATEVAWEGEETPGKMSIFTSYLVRGLETGEADNDADGLIGVDELYDYVHEQLSYVSSQQTPGKWIEDQRGSIYIAKNPRPSPKTPKPPPPPAEAEKNVSARPISTEPVSNENSLSNLLHGVRRICPACSNEFYPGDCDIISASGGEVFKKGEVLKAAPRGGVQRQLARRNPEPLTGPAYVQVMARRVCPHCGYQLPYNIEAVENKSIVVIGDVFSGKSHLLAAIVRQIEDGEQYSRVMCLTEDVQKMYHRDIYELFEGKRALAMTMQAIPDRPREEPLIYELTTARAAKMRAMRYNLILYDTSGEDYATSGRLLRYCPYVLNASALIFLADPLTMPAVRDSLPSHLQTQLPANATTGRKTTHVFDLVIQLMEQRHGAQYLSRIPIAITLSKSDLFTQFLGPKSRNDQYRFSLQPGYENGIDLQDLSIVDHEVRTVIDMYSNRSLLRVAEGIKHVQFFAISVTGSPSDINGQYPDVKPVRCYDPFLWCLYKLGLVNAR